MYKFRSMRTGADKGSLIITDWASIEYVDENVILGQAEDLDKAYIEQIMPDKIKVYG